MNKTKVAIDARMINHSGIGTYTANILRRIIPMRPDWDFIILGNTEILKKLELQKNKNCEILDFNKKIYGISEQIWWLKHKKIADLLWVPHYNVPILWNRRLVVTVHDIAHLILPETKSNFLKYRYARFMMNWIRSRASQTIFVSNFTRSEFNKFVGRPKHGVNVIGEGVDPAWLSAQPDDRAATPYLIFLGNIKPHKNLIRLLTAFSRLADTIPHNLVLVGKAEGFMTEAPEVAAMAKQLGNRIHMTGRISDEAVRSYVAGAELLVLPSLYEGFGLPVVEAMACGCPVLASNGSSLPEVGGDAAAYCDPLDTDDIVRQILAILQNPERRREMSERGREHVKAFDWTSTASETLKVFEAAL